MNHPASVSVQQIRWLEQSARQTGNTEHKILYWLFMSLTGFHSDTTKRLEALEAVLLPQPADPPASATGDLSGAAEAVLNAFLDQSADGNKDLAEQGRPHPPAISGRPPRPDECDREGRVWVWHDETATDPPGWDLQHHSAVIEILQIESQGDALGPWPSWHKLRWRPASGVPMEEKQSAPVEAGP